MGLLLSLISGVNLQIDAAFWADSHECINARKQHALPPAVRPVGFFICISISSSVIRVFTRPSPRHLPPSSSSSSSYCFASSPLICLLMRRIKLWYQRRLETSRLNWWMRREAGEDGGMQGGRRWRWWHWDERVRWRDKLQKKLFCSSSCQLAGC